MKYVVRWLVVGFVLLSLVGGLACSGDGRRGGNDASSPSGDTDENGAPSSDSSSDSADQDSSGVTGTGGGFWSDMPVYAASTQIEKGTWSIPPQEDSKYFQVEWRYYELPDGSTPDMVARFYQMEMPKHGWQEMMNQEVQGTTMTFFTKNGENDAAYVWATIDNGKLVYALMRATK